MEEGKITHVLFLVHTSIPGYNSSVTLLVFIIIFTGKSAAIYKRGVFRDFKKTKHITSPKP